MQQGKTGLSKVELLRRTGVSDRQLKRWRKEGLVPTPELKSQGHARGMEARYPIETVELVESIQRKLERTRSLINVGWWLWTEGRDEYTQFVRDAFRALLDESEDALSSGLEAFYEDRPENPVEQARAKRLNWGVGWLRKVTGREAFTTDVFFALVGLLGELNDAQFREEIPPVLQKSLQTALDGAGWPDDQDPVTPEETKDSLTTLFNQFNVRTAMSWIERASDSELLSVRDEARACFQSWAPEQAEDEPLPPSLFVTVWNFRMIYSDSDLDEPFREIIEYLLHHSNPSGPVLGAKLRDIALQSQFPPE